MKPETEESLTAGFVAVLTIAFNVVIFFFTDLGILEQSGLASSLLISVGRVAVLLVAAYAAYSRGIDNSSLFIGLIGFSALFFTLRAVEHFFLNSENELIALVSFAAFGIASGLGLLLSGTILCTFTAERARGIILSGFILAAIIVFISQVQQAVDNDILRLAYYVLFLLSLTIFFFTSKRLPKRLAPVKEILSTDSGGKAKILPLFLSKGITPLITFAATALFTLIFGLFECYFFMTGASRDLSRLPIIIVIILYSVSYVVSKIKNSRSWFNGLFLAISLVTILSIPLMLISTEFTPLFFLVLWVTISLLQIPIWIYLVDMASDELVSPVFLFGLFPAVLAIFHMLGRLISSVLPRFVEVNDTLGSSLALGVLVLIAIIAVVVLALVLRDKNKNPGQSLTGSATANTWDKNFETVSNRYDFTDREKEIIGLYAHGRSVPFISSNLFIAQSTVKTHIGNVYAKMEIHTKQELLDVLGEPKTSTLSKSNNPVRPFEKGCTDIGKEASSGRNGQKR